MADILTKFSKTYGSKIGLECLQGFLMIWPGDDIFELTRPIYQMSGKHSLTFSRCLVCKCCLQSVHKVLLYDKGMSDSDSKGA